MIAKERQRKVVNNLVKEVLQAYWSASIAEKVLPKIDPILAQAEQALETSRTIQDNNLQPVVNVLEYQRSLLRIIAQLKNLKSDLLIAKPKLAGLINAPMNSKFSLASDANNTPEPPDLNVPVTQLEELGLFHRPELREEMYQERISRADAWKEILKIMPGINIPLSVNWDSNSFLFSQLWLDAGVRTTFNLVNLVAAPKIWDSAQTQIEVSKIRRKALTVAALVQINIGYQQYIKSLDSYKNAKELSKVDQGILQAISNSADNDAASDLERIHAATSALASELEKEQSLSEVYAALGNIYSSIGLNPANVNIENFGVSDLSVMLKNNIDQWFKGRFPALPAPMPVKK